MDCFNPPESWEIDEEYCFDCDFPCDVFQFCRWEEYL